MRALPVSSLSIVDVESPISVIAKPTDSAVRAQISACLARVANEIKVDGVTAYMLGFFYAADPAIVFWCAARRGDKDVAKAFGKLIDNNLQVVIEAVGSARPGNFRRRE